MKNVITVVIHQEEGQTEIIQVKRTEHAEYLIQKIEESEEGPDRLWELEEDEEIEIVNTITVDAELTNKSWY